MCRGKVSNNGGYDLAHTLAGPSTALNVVLDAQLCCHRLRLLADVVGGSVVALSTVVRTCLRSQWMLIQVSAAQYDIALGQRVAFDFSVTTTAAFQGLILAEVEAQQQHVGPSVVGGGDASKPLRPRSVKDLQLQELSVGQCGSARVGTGRCERCGPMRSCPCA